MALDLAAVLLPQWQNSPRLRAVVTDVVEVLRDDGLDAFAAIERMRNLDDAEGVWLDYLGIRIGLPRPPTNDPTQDPRFGFGTAGEPFDQAPFRGSQANAAVFPLPDPVYRRFIRARAITITGDGTLADFVLAVRTIDEAATVTDNRDMTITVESVFHDLLSLADEHDALPRGAGVMVNYQAPP